MPEGLSLTDPCSWSNPSDVCITHMDIEFNVNFETKVLESSVDIECTKKKENVTHLILDSKDLTILQVYDSDGRDLPYTIGEPLEGFGSAFKIELPDSPDDKVKISIKYNTSPKATALQWLNPELTAGKEWPFLYSQCQAIHARSLVPCQDTPYVKFTYSSQVIVPENLTALMSAVSLGSSPDRNGTVRFKFRQSIVIPSYLIALAVGKLEYRQIGPRSRVWSEKEYVDKAANEFTQTEEFLSIAEKICGPYIWEVYDLLVLPPTFPFGGMENPCLTFVTPTLLAGDRSLADVIIHEISHSWTGNLVTNSTFEHFWLNEGFTVFIERKILGVLSGEPARHFHAISGLNDLKYTVNHLGDDNPLTNLVVDLKGVNPDDAFSTCPYEKGHTFLFYLETVVGGAEQFDPFLRSYIEKYKYKSISTCDFLDYFREYFKTNESICSIDWKSWLHSPGMPPRIPNYDSTLLKASQSLATRWLEWDLTKPSPFTLDELHALLPKQIEAFLNCLLEGPDLPVEKLKQMQNVYNFNSCENNEIQFRWFRLCIKGKWLEQIPSTLTFVTCIGRMKFVRPLYRDLYAWPDAREAAVANFLAHYHEMMYVTAHTVSKDLNLTI